MFNIEDMVNKAISHKATVSTFQKDIKNNKIVISEKEKSLNNLNTIYSATKDAYVYLDRLVKEESGKFIKKLNDILDYGVKTIFDDCDYSVEIRVSDNNKATIHLVYDDEFGNKLDPNIQSCGGGIRTVIGVLLQIFFIFHYRTEKIIIVDEGFSQVSSQYLPNLFSLIDELATKNGLKILLVTHDNRMLDYGSRRYEINKGTAKLVDKDEEVDDADNSNSIAGR